MGTLYRDIIVADGPVGYWRLGETGGTSAVDEMATNNGTYTAGYTLNQASALPGDPDPSVALNGSTGYVTIPDAAIYSITNASLFTVECWANATGVTSTDGTLVAKGIVNEYEWRLGQSLNRWRCQIWDAAGNEQAFMFGGAVVPGLWFHVAFTCNDTTDVTILYVNGGEVARSTAAMSALTNNTSPVNIGRRPDNVQFWDGKIDEVAIYNVVLTPAQMFNHFRAGAGHYSRGVSQAKYELVGSPD